MRDVLHIISLMLCRTSARSPAVGINLTRSQSSGDERGSGTRGVIREGRRQRTKTSHYPLRSHARVTANTQASPNKRDGWRRGMMISP